MKQSLLPSIIVICFLFCSFAQADEASKPSERDAPDAPLIQVSEWKWKSLIFNDEPRDYDLRAEVRERFDYLANPFRKGLEPKDEHIISSRARVRFAYYLPANFQFLFEFQDSRPFFARAYSYTTVNTINTADIQQAFFAYHDVHFTDTLKLDIEAGRINMDLGRRRLIARTDFSNTTNAFDGVHFKLQSEQAAWSLRGFVTKFVTRLPTDPDHFWDGPLVDGLSFDQNLPDHHVINFYAIHVQDALGGGNQRDFITPGLRIQKTATLNEFDYEVEQMLQYGSKGTVAQAANYTHGEVGYSFGNFWATPQFQLLFDYASPTFDALYGERRFDLTPIGIFQPFARTNIVSPGARVTIKPIPDSRLTFRYRKWNLANATYPWASSGLADPTGKAGSNLGGDFEIRAAYDFTPNLTTEFGWDHLCSGTFQHAFHSVVNNPNADDSNYAYVQLRVKI